MMGYVVGIIFMFAGALILYQNKTAETYSDTQMLFGFLVFTWGMLFLTAARLQMITDKLKKYGHLKFDD